MQCDAPVAHGPEPDTRALPAPAISCSRAISANAIVPMAPLRKPGKGVGDGGDGGPQPGDGEGERRVPAAAFTLALRTRQARVAAVDGGERGVGAVRTR